MTIVKIKCMRGDNHFYLRVVFILLIFYILGDIQEKHSSLFGGKQMGGIL